jgi:2-phosphoglycerate kinase
MRAMFSPELMPSLHTSSFQAGGMLRESGLQGTDRVIAGFREQTAAVSVGLNAFLTRAALEGTSVIIEGAHMVPGFVDVDSTRGRVLAIPVVVTVEDEDVHRSHFAVRATDVASRPSERYARGFENIRRIQKFIRSQALSHGVPVIPNYSLDQAIAAVLDLVVERATQHAERMGGGDADGPASLAEPTAEVAAGNGASTKEESTGVEPVARSTGSST